MSQISPVTFLGEKATDGFLHPRGTRQGEPHGRFYTWALLHPSIKDSHLRMMKKVHSDSSKEAAQAKSAEEAEAAQAEEAQEEEGEVLLPRRHIGQSLCKKALLESTEPNIFFDPG